MHIQIFSDDTFAAAPLEKRLRQHGLEHSAYQPGDAIKATHFVLFSPVWCNEQFVVCDSVWKKYFEVEKSRAFRKIGLVTAGYERAKHENYLCLLDLPEDLPAFFEEALPCHEAWQPFPVKGTDMAQALRRFYLGHGNESVLAAFDSIATKVRDIEKHRATMPFEKILEGENSLVSPAKLGELWHNFRVRWGHYRPFAPSLPFYPRLAELEEISKNMDVFFQTGCSDVNLFAENKVAARTQRIKDILEECSAYAS
ncbi:MAG: hypothetical protein ACKVUS_18350 [Saprospiraceae bacterium]